MTRQLLVECFINRRCSCSILVARQPTRIGIRNAQGGIIELVGTIEPHARFLLLVGELQDQAGVQVLENRIPFRTRQLVDA